ncbi:rhodanese-like domain-containing protein [Lujinxingia vulgaris]|uniref:Rhodanese-like domain-containing protein n=2 Tax=Lujinxingia vulgaris TaxID=2600176 RepID=A0A5C6XCC1_9DELT|nr:rhodanese-like domain-containing protein [Lujinxingia vulgaris]
MARLMSSTELQQRIAEGEDFVLIDILNPEDYQREHIPGAINIPVESLKERARKDLGKNQRIVVYGDSHDAEASNRAAKILEELGFRKVSDFDGGLNAWKNAGFLTEGSEAEIVGEVTRL